MDTKAIMDAAGIPADLQRHCFVTEDGMIFTPREDDNGNRLATGEEAYQSWLEAKETPPEATAQQRMDEMEAALADIMYGGAAV